MATGIPLLLRLYVRGNEGTRFKRLVVAVVVVVKFSVLVLAILCAFFQTARQQVNFDFKY